MVMAGAAYPPRAAAIVDATGRDASIVVSAGPAYVTAGTAMVVAGAAME